MEKSRSGQGLWDNVIIAVHFCRCRWLLKFKNEDQLQSWQTKKLQKFLRVVLPKADHYKSLAINALSDLPFMDKAQMMENFAERNTLGIRLAQAFEIAEQAERSRNFKPTLGDITIGMSSGTSGKRGVFLVSRHERLKWAGTLLARTLPSALLKQILTPWREPLRIAFFLRANSNLYDTLSSRRIDFQFFDLLAGLEKSFEHLNAHQSHVLVAPATVLRHLALAKLKGDLSIKPTHIVSVAEVLEQCDCELVRRAFGISPHQIYQATEGFLAYTCSQGSLHLNETHIYVEKEWLDDTKTRFQPVITDFSRTTQLIVRYKLNDILRVAEKPCACGCPELTLAAVEGRSDEILWLPSLNGNGLSPLYPDLIRRTMALIEPVLDEYSIVQHAQDWVISFSCEAEFNSVCQIISQHISDLCSNLLLIPPRVTFGNWTPPTIGAKRRRIVCKIL